MFNFDITNLNRKNKSKIKILIAFEFNSLFKSIINKKFFLFYSKLKYY
jgi:hypothetical protein